jgi:RNA polymerase sigma factor FliA
VTSGEDDRRGGAESIRPSRTDQSDFAYGQGNGFCIIWLYAHATLSITINVMPAASGGIGGKGNSMSLIREVLVGSQESDGGPSDLRSAADALWAQYWQDRSREHRNHLVLFYAPLVTIVAKRFARRSRSADGVEELCSFGTFGLIDAIERWDASEGFQFATYATRRIQGAIIDELRHEDFLPKRLRARVQVFHATRDDLESTLKRTPTIGEIAAGLGVEVAEAINLRDEATSLTHLAPLTEGNAASEGRILAAATSDRTPTEGAELAAMNDSVKAALRRLTERQRTALVLYFLEGLAKSEIADILGVGRPRVTQLVQQGLHNLRIELGVDQPSDIEDLLPDPSLR